MDIKEFYEDSQGNRYFPKLYTESFCYLRSDTHGHVRTMICPIDDGEVLFNKKAIGFRDGRHDPRNWLQQHSESLPQQFYSEAVHQKIAEAQKLRDNTDK